MSLLDATVARALDYWAPRPLAFFEEAFDPPIRLWPASREWVTEYQERMRHGEKHTRMLVRGCHGSSKTFTAAALFIHRFVTRWGTIGMTMGPNWSTVGDSVWGEVEQAWAKCILSPVKDFRIVTGECKFQAGPKAWKWMVRGRSTDKSTNLEGMHGRSVIRLVDEAKVVGDDMFEATEGIFNPCEESWDCWISTAGPKRGEFYARDMGRSAAVIRKQITIDRLVADGIPGAERWRADRLERWGENSSMYRARARAEYVDDVSGGAIEPDWLDAARERRADDVDSPSAIVAGLDAGRSDDGNLSVLAFGRGWSPIGFQKWQTRQSMTVAKEAFVACRDRGVKRLRVDCNGLGGPIHDRIDEQLRTEYGEDPDAWPFQLEEYRENESPSDKEFANRHAEVTDLFAQACRRGEVAMGDLDEDDFIALRSELCQYVLGMFGKSVRTSVDKDPSGQHSPDFGDAHLIAVAPPIENALSVIYRDLERRSA